MLALTQGLLSVSGASVTFQSATGPNYIASGTSINTPASPSGVQAGDGLFAILFARSAVTPPVGWTLIRSQSNVSNATTQTLHVYRKDSTSSADSSTAFTWSQAAALRMGLAYVLVRSSTSSISIIESGSIETDIASASTFDVPVSVLTASSPGELFLVAATALASNSSPTNDSWSSLGVEVVRGTSSQPDNRLAMFTASRDAGQSNSANVRFVFGSNVGPNDFSTVAVRVGAS